MQHVRAKVALPQPSILFLWVQLPWSRSCLPPISLCASTWRCPHTLVPWATGSSPLTCRPKERRNPSFSAEPLSSRNSAGVMRPLRKEAGSRTCADPQHDLRVARSPSTPSASVICILPPMFSTSHKHTRFAKLERQLRERKPDVSDRCGPLRTVRERWAANEAVTLPLACDLTIWYDFSFPYWISWQELLIKLQICEYAPQFVLTTRAPGHKSPPCPRIGTRNLQYMTWLWTFQRSLVPVCCGGDL